MNEIEALNADLAKTAPVILMPDKYTAGQQVGQFNVEDVKLEKYAGADRYTLHMNGATVTSWSLRLPRRDFDCMIFKGKSINLTGDGKKFLVKVIA